MNHRLAKTTFALFLFLLVNPCAGQAVTQPNVVAKLDYLIDSDGLGGALSQSKQRYETSKNSGVFSLAEIQKWIKAFPKNNVEHDLARNQELAKLELALSNTDFPSPSVDGNEVLELLTSLFEKTQAVKAGAKTKAITITINQETQSLKETNWLKHGNALEKLYSEFEALKIRVKQDEQARYDQAENLYKNIVSQYQTDRTKVENAINGFLSRSVAECEKLQIDILAKMNDRYKNSAPGAFERKSGVSAMATLTIENYDFDIPQVSTFGFDQLFEIGKAEKNGQLLLSLISTKAEFDKLVPNAKDDGVQMGQVFFLVSSIAIQNSNKDVADIMIEALQSHVAGRVGYHGDSDQKKVQLGMFIRSINRLSQIPNSNPKRETRIASIKAKVVTAFAK